MIRALIRASAGLILALWLATPALAEICTASGEFFWGPTAVTDPPGGWPDCAPDPTDQFIINTDDDYVKVVAGAANAITLTFVGEQLACDAGVLEIPADGEINWTDQITIDGSCLLRSEGAVVAQGRVLEEPTWAANTTDIVVDATPAAAGRTWLRFLSDDPADIEATAGTDIKIGLGPPTKEQVRAGYEKWRWYYINTIGTTPDSIQFFVDACLGGFPVACAYGALGGGQLPYTGTYGHLEPTLQIAGTAGGAAGALNPLQYRHMTDVRVLTGTVNNNVIDEQDGTDQWLYFVESPGGGSGLASECQGLSAKVLDSEDLAGAADRVWVASDVSHCHDGDFVITRGARRGDPWEQVLPVFWDGNDTGYLDIRGGRHEIERSYFFHLGTKDRLSETVNLGSQCSVCVYQGDGTTFPDLSRSYFRDNAIGWATDTLDSGSSSAAYALDGAGYDWGGLRFSPVHMDAEGYSLRRNYIHDNLNPTTGEDSGMYGMWLASVRNLHVEQNRVERMEGGGINSAYGDDTLNPPRWRNEYRRNILLADLGDDDKFTKSFRVGIQIAASATDANAYPLIFVDNFVGASNGHVFMFHGWGVNVDRSVFFGFGGEGDIAPGSMQAAIGGTIWSTFGCTSATTPDPCCSASCPLRPSGSSGRPSAISDSILLAIGSPPFRIGGAANRMHAFGWAGIIQDSIVGGANRASGRIRFKVHGIKNTFVDLGDAGTASDRFFMVVQPQSGGVTPHDNAHAPFEVFDSIMTSNTLNQDYIFADALNTITAIDLQRSWFLFHTLTLNGPLNPLNLQAIPLEIDGLFISYTNIAAVGAAQPLGINNNPIGPLDFLNVCYHSSHTRPLAFDSHENETTSVFQDLRPTQADNLRVGRMVRDPRKSLGLCEKTKPESLGITELGVEMLLLGDFFLENLIDFSSSVRLD